MKSGRAKAAALATVVGAVTFLALLLAVEAKWPPLLSLDQHARDGLHQYGLTHPGITGFLAHVSSISGAGGWQDVSIALVVWLLTLRQIRAAVFVVVTNTGSSFLNTVLKAAVHRPRPALDHPLAHASGWSFPSGHAQAAATGFMVVLLVLWPRLPSNRVRRWAASGAAAAALVIGYSRVALGVHFVSDVITGYVVGVAWAVVLASALDVWHPSAVRDKDGGP